MPGLSLVAVTGCLLSGCGVRASLWRLLLLVSTNLGSQASVVVAHELSFPAAGGILGTELFPPHWWILMLLDHQGVQESRSSF